MAEIRKSIKQIDKRCSRCGVIKPISDFGKSHRSPSGYTGVCKECVNERDRLEYGQQAQEDREKEIFELLNWFLKNQEAKLARQELVDSYIRALLTNRTTLSTLDPIPVWAIKLKRLHILLKRERRHQNGKNRPK